MDGDARSDVKRLEVALAEAAYERDRLRDEARFAADGVVDLEHRLERLQVELEGARRAAERVADLEQSLELERREAGQSREATARLQQELAGTREAISANEAALAEARDAAGVAERELASTRARLEIREQELEVRDEELTARQQELERLRLAAIEAEGDLRELGSRLEASDRELASTRDAFEARAAVLAEVELKLEASTAGLAEVELKLEARTAGLAEAELKLEALNRTLATRQQHLENARAGIESRDRKLESRAQESERLRADLREGERRLAAAESQLEGAHQRAERLESSLLAIRAGRSYRMMRFLWRLRRPFRRAKRVPAAHSAPVDEDPEPSRAAPSPVVLAEAAPPRSGARRLRVAAILDEMSAACFAPECDLVPLSLEGWREQLEQQRPDLLLVESAWQGNGGEWHYRIAKYRRKDLAGLPVLRELLDTCRQLGIPTAFWNKEDPVHFDRFAEAASLFDHVFTTDARCIDRYRDLPGERTVAALPFAAQPRIHNPTAAVDRRSASPCFAGAWYRDRHPDRRRALEAVLDAARPFGLVIYDRTFGVEDPAFGFPDRFQPHVLGKLPYERVLGVYKSHRVFLNANSVVDSPTMCSRRVFELAACDTAILSTPGAALSALLGDAVAEADDEAGAAEALRALLEDDEGRAHRTRAARRAVFAEHTYADRLATIADAAGLDSSSLRAAPFAAPGDPDGGESPWVLKLGAGVELSATALADVGAAALYADADVIGTSPRRNGDAAVEHRQVDWVDPRAVLVRREALESRGWPAAGSGEEVERRLREWAGDGVRIYAGDSDWLAGAAPAPAIGAV
jgi:glycosyltransferase involved in cell wall biosynthesis